MKLKTLKNSKLVNRTFSITGMIMVIILTQDALVIQILKNDPLQYALIILLAIKVLYQFKHDETPLNKKN